MRWRSRSMSSTCTCTVSPISRISEGWLTCDQESSEMWIRPSMPSRSTKAPKSTMFELWPSPPLPACGEIRAAGDVDQRGGQEAAHAEVEDQPALDDLDHAAVHRLARFRCALD